jgi:transcriptional regulator with XRE-family HTH domain
MEPVYSFGEWLRLRRETLNLTRVELARCVDCSVSALRKIEADERRPSRQLAELLAGCLEIPSGQLAAFLDAARGRRRVDRLGAPQPTTVPSGSQSKPARTISSLPTPATPLVGREAELVVCSPSSDREASARRGWRWRQLACSGKPLPVTSSSLPWLRRRPRNSWCRQLPRR